MELCDLYRLTYLNRASLIWSQGEFLLTRYEPPFCISLYYMGKFFAEIQYNGESNDIDLVRGFNGHLGLSPYLEMIGLSELSS